MHYPSASQIVSRIISQSETFLQLCTGKTAEAPPPPQPTAEGTWNPTSVPEPSSQTHMEFKL